MCTYKLFRDRQTDMKTFFFIDGQVIINRQRLCETCYQANQGNTYTIW